MKLRIYFSLCFLLFFLKKSVPVVGSGGNIFGQTNFTFIPEFLAGGAIRIDFMPTLERNKQKERGGVKVVFVDSHSTNSDKIAQFYTPHGDLLLATTGGNDYFVPGPLTITAPNPTNKVVRDLDAQILEISDDEFCSLTSFNPYRRVRYAGFFGYYNLSYNEDNTPQWAVMCAFPLVSCFHEINAKENIYKKGSAMAQSPITSVLEGLNRDALRFQKWNTNGNGMNTLSVPSIELDLNYSYFLNKQSVVESYFGFIFAIKNNLKNSLCWDEYIFPPKLGNSDHFGLQYGVTIDLMLYENSERAIKFVFGNNLLYYLPSTEYRSFDLLGRPWSRYLYAYENYSLKNQLQEPLVNFLTMECRVTPNFSNIATSEFHYIRRWLTLAVGYSLFSRQSESVTILNDIPNLVLVGSNPDITLCKPVSIVRTPALRLPNEDVQVKVVDMISEQNIFDKNFFYAKIDNTMIDIASATHPAVFCGELYLKGKCDLFDLGKAFFGCSYKFSHTNSAIEYATYWLGLEHSF